MAGIYIHIPFCKTRCIYCDFYSTTNSEQKQRYIFALCRELRMRKNYLKGKPVKTIYFGGGTPSQLNEADFKQIFKTIENFYGLSAAKEITLEANPDDLTEEYVAMLRTFPFNRISIGIQTFDDAGLKQLNRRHTGAQAIEAVERCRRAGFQNISIDLIYGLPGETDEHWKHDLQQAVALNVEHISAYHLMYEQDTPLQGMVKAHRILEVDEESSLRFFNMLMDTLEAAGYEQYEISNFCKPGMHSRHNSSYWNGVPYLGCGPSAHSFNTRSREWNISSLEEYMTSIEKDKRSFQLEELKETTRYNEYIMTSLRTKWGISLKHIEQTFGIEFKNYCMEMADPYVDSKKLEAGDNFIRLSREGIFISDDIMCGLMYLDDEDLEI